MAVTEVTYERKRSDGHFGSAGIIITATVDEEHGETAEEILRDLQVRANAAIDAELSGRLIDDPLASASAADDDTALARPF